MDCKQQSNKANCKCTYEPCPRKGVCCECIAHHLQNKELPACCFDAKAERTYDRSISHFLKLGK